MREIVCAHSWSSENASLIQESRWVIEAKNSNLRRKIGWLSIGVFLDEESIARIFEA
jgi:hypothetical protein